ncbi:MAG: hypothetical protein JXR83_04485 [Deltaproteobacteria bacterium]|nr:hypothetical protein [Deltaproteobacteria bacterium]
MTTTGRGMVRGALAALAVWVACAGGCECEDNLLQVPQPWCDLTTQCKSNQAYRYGKCIDSYCESDTECCPGTFCSLAQHSCLDNRFRAESECRFDGDCYDHFHDRGLYCQLDGEAGSCGYRSCRDGVSCPEGTACFMGWCVGAAPCGGVCPPGQVCEVGSNACHPVVGQSGCDQSCAAGQLLVLENPDVMAGDICCPISCLCSTLPPLQPGSYGRFSSIAVTPAEVLVSAYDETYGDLVLVRVSAQGLVQSVEYVDGVPATGTAGGDLAGPRGGLVEPGTDVGQYTSLVLDSQGQPRIAYYDVDNGDLRLALWDAATAGWNTYAVDIERDAGRYASLIVDASDKLRVSYFVSGLERNGHAATALRIASSRVAAPAAATDWQIADVEVAEVRDPCNDACQANQACVLVQGAPTCRPLATTCSSCATNQRCVTITGGASCMAVMPPDLHGLPRGVGLFSSLAHTPGGDLVVYYDAVHGDLKGALVTTAPQTPVTLDGDGASNHRGGDVGRFCSIAYDAVNGVIAVAYEDTSGHALRLFRGADLSRGNYELIESGIGAPPGVTRLSDVALTCADGKAYAAFQDATDADLVLAVRETNGSWRSQRLLSDGAYGFDPSIAVGGGSIYAANLGPRLDSRRLLASRLVVFVQPQ